MKKSIILVLTIMVFILSPLTALASEEQGYSNKYDFLNEGASKEMTVEEYVDFLLQRHERFEGWIEVRLDGEYTKQEIIDFLSGRISYKSIYITLAPGTDLSRRIIALEVGEESIRETLISLLKDAVPQIVNCWPEYADKPGSNDVIGDVNSDGQVNASDYIILKRHILCTYTVPEDLLSLGDVNRDGSINANDYLLLKRIVLKTWTGSN